MKNIKLSLIAIIGLATALQAGGDISPVTPYEIEDAQMAIESATVTPIEKEIAPIVAIPVLPKSKYKDVVEPQPTKDSTTKNSSSSAYIGLGGVVAQYDTNCKCPDKTLSGTDKTGGFIAKAGYDFNRYIGIEARGIKTMIKEDGGEIEHVGAFIKPSLPLGDKTHLYGLLGWAKTTTSGTLRKTDVDGLALGAGFGYDVGEHATIFVDYERLFQKSDAPKLDAVSMGANYKF